MKNFLLISLVCLAAGALGAETIAISVYFESLCPFCKAFVTGQLYPTKQALGDALQLDLVPYGKATTELNSDGSWNFTCQHGPDECYGNKIEACAVTMYRDLALDFINCAELSDDTASDDALSVCANSTGIPWSMLKQCYDLGIADELLATYGERTHDVNVEWVPTIVFDYNVEDVANVTLQNAAMVDLKGLVCGLLDNAPEACQPPNGLNSSN